MRPKEGTEAQEVNGPVEPWIWGLWIVHPFTVLLHTQATVSGNSHCAICLTTCDRRDQEDDRRTTGTGTLCQRR
jgi:hypothetical protein